jgi:rod shape-determining protein MreD
VSVSRFLLGAATVLTALLLQGTVVARVPLPGAAPDLLLVVVVAFALAEGPLSGMSTGFVTGLLADVLSDHNLGRLALAYAVVGYLAGMLQDDTERSTVLPFAVVGMSAAGALLVYGFEGVVLGDPRITLAAAGRMLVSQVPYDVVLTPFVVPLVGALVRRLAADQARR